MIIGSCLCGDIAWEVAHPFDAIWHCHCSLCRKAHGTAFATIGLASGFRWLRGEGSLRNFSVTGVSQRPFCPSCGSVLARVTGARAFIPMGCQDGDPGACPSGHLFAG